MAKEYVDCLKSRVRKSVSELVDELKLADPDDGLTVCDLRLIDYTTDKGGLIRVTRCFVHAGANESLWNTGWIVNEGCLVCLKCSLSFGIFRWRHHCRACGAVICAQCSRYSPIPAFASADLERVCSSCYQGENIKVVLLDNRDEGERLITNSPFQERRPPRLALQTPKTSESATLSEVETTAPTPTAAPQFYAIPLPGFVIKTRRPTGEKVFINVYHNQSVVDLRGDILLHILPPNPDQFVVPVIYMKPPSLEGTGNVIYNVVVSSNYFLSPTTRITSPICVQKIIECLNVTYRDTMLEDEYVRPRIKSGVKGMPITTPEIFQLNTVSVSCYCRITPRADNRSVASQSHRFVPAIDSWQESGHAANDEHSIVSDLTLQSTDARTPSHFLSRRNAGLLSFMARKYGGSGRSMLKDDMLEHREPLNADAEEIKELLLQSTTKPGVLLGWQIVLQPVAQVVDEDPNFDKRIYVISGMAKNGSFQTEYRISCLEREDMWVRLQRSEKKHGFPFRPLRKVLDLD